MQLKANRLKAMLYDSYLVNKNVNSCSRLSTARGPCMCNISWV